MIDKVVAEFGDWAPPLRNLIAGSDDLPVVRPIYALPTGMIWPRVRGATLLGDAAHPMSPFAGEGANLATLDGMELTNALVANPTDQEGALAAYERSLFPRSTRMTEISARNLKLFFGATAPASVVELFTPGGTKVRSSGK